MRLDWDNGQCQRVARQVEEIKTLGREAADLRLRPHPGAAPALRLHAGRTLPDPAESKARGPDRGYVEQVGYANAIIRELVPALLAEGGRRRSS